MKLIAYVAATLVLLSGMAVAQTTTSASGGQQIPRSQNRDLGHPTTNTGAPAKLLPYQDAKLPAEQRITDLIQRMTPEEKLAMLGTDPTIPRSRHRWHEPCGGAARTGAGRAGRMGRTGPRDADDAVSPVARAGPDVGPRAC